MVEWLDPGQFAERVPCHWKTVIRAIKAGRLKAKASDGWRYGDSLEWTQGLATLGNCVLAAGQLKRFKLMPGGPRKGKR